MTQRGVLQRRHVKIDIFNIHYIGKESNEFEEQFYLGFDEDDEIAYGKETEVDAAFFGCVSACNFDPLRRGIGVQN